MSVWTVDGRNEPRSFQVRAFSAARARTRLRLACLLGLVVAGLVSVHPVAAVAAASRAPAAPSAVGNEAVFWLAVSPAYQRTGLVVAMTVQSGGSCGNQCKHLWVSHDGGSSWYKAAGTGWSGVRPAVGVDSHGRETVFDVASSGMVASSDYGDTWKPVAPAAMPTVSPRFASDGLVAGAGSEDYLYHYGGSVRQVAGSGGGQTLDLGFGLAPSWPSAGTNPPALLVGEDKKSQLPVVERCDSNLTCSNPFTLSAAQPSYADTSLHFSTTYAQDGTVFARNSRALYKSTDGGQTFVQLQVGASGASATAIAMIALAPGYAQGGSQGVYAAVLQVFGTGTNATSSGGIYASTTGGLAWTKMGVGSPLDGGDSAVAVAPDGRLFAGYLPAGGIGSTHVSGLLCSADGGSSWAASCPSVGNYYATHQRPGGASNTTGASTTPAHNGGCATSNCTVLNGVHASPTPGASTSSAHLGSAAGGETITGGGARSTIPKVVTWIAPVIALGLAAAVATGVIAWRRRARHFGRSGL